MKIVIFSDTHGDIQIVRDLFQKEKNADAFVFLGDGLAELNQVQHEMSVQNLFAVRGNCDRNLRIPSEQLHAFANHLVFFTHGDGYEVKWTLQGLKKAARQRGAEVVLFGHTHVPYYEFDEGLYLFNPGSISLSRAGKESYGILTLEEDKHPQFTHVEVTK